MKPSDLNFSDVLDQVREDQKVENENFIQSYHSLVTENIRSNNRKISRNSFGMIIVVTIYFLMLFEGVEVLSLESLFGIKDPSILFNFLPIIFSFFYLQNITLWNNNINLLPIFERLSSEMFNLGSLTDTVNVIKPFSLLHHILNYQYENKKVNGLLKIPSGIAFLILLFSPIFFDAFFMILLLLKGINLTSLISFIIVFILTFTTVVQAFNSSKP